MPPRRSRREDVISHAVDVVAVSGLDALTVGRLATDLGFSKSGVFGLFGSKDELQLATVRRAYRNFRDEVLDPADRAPAGAPRLRVLVEACVASLEVDGRGGGCVLASIVSEGGSRPGPVGDVVRTGLTQWLERLEREARYASAPDPPRLALELFGLMLGANAVFQVTGDITVFARTRAAVDGRLACIG